MGYVLGKRSLSRLVGVHPDLVRVVHRAIEITEVDFSVLEGVRSCKRQYELLLAGASRTMNSRHIPALPKVPVPGMQMVGHAVDLGAWVGRELRWDWPLYPPIARAMKQAAGEQNVAITWGGDWKSFRDGPHYELSWKAYPIGG